MTVRFFMWEFMMAWYDTLVPLFEEAFTLNFCQAMLAQFASFGTYATGGLVYYRFGLLPMAGSIPYHAPHDRQMAAL